MRHNFILLLLVFISIQLWGQESATHDKITLNTGEVYVGDIIAKTNELIMIKTPNGKRFQFQLSEVKKIEKTEQSENSSTFGKQVPDITRKGFFCGNIELSGGVSDAKNSFSSSPFAEGSMVFGAKNISGKDVFFGVGVGYNLTFLSSTTDPLSLLPVFLRFQSVLIKARTAPFIGVDAGYSFGLNQSYNGGLMLRPSVGIVHKTGYKSDIYAGFFAGLTSISAPLIVTNELGTFNYHAQTSMTNFGLKFGFHF